jgi:hypothetical protein
MALRNVLATEGCKTVIFSLGMVQGRAAHPLLMKTRTLSKTRTTALLLVGLCSSLHTVLAQELPVDMALGRHRMEKSLLIPRHPIEPLLVDT